MAATLTAATVERTKPDPVRRLELPDALLPGLYLVVQPSGAKSWAIRYRNEGRTRKHVLGRYPRIDLAAARQQAREALQAVAVGRDPGAEKIQARKVVEPDSSRDLVSGAIESFIARHVRPNTKPSSGGERLLRKHVLPRWQGKRLDAIRRADVVALLDELVDAGIPVGANRVFALVRKFFGWCVERGLLETSPCLRVKAPTAEASRDRVLSEDELRLAWLAAGKLGFPFGSMVQLLILTAQRRDEAAGMTRAELSGELWTVVAARSKNGSANDVPLSAAAKTVLAGLPAIVGDAGFVFTTTGNGPIKGFSKYKARLDRDMLVRARGEAEKRGEDPDRVVIPPWRLHDLRRTAASGMARLGTPVHVTEAVLNHTSGSISGVAAIYNRHKYLDEKRIALEAWGEHVAAIVGDRRL